MTEPEPEVVHFLDAYTFLGRRGSCGQTAPTLTSVHDRSEVTCPACLAVLSDPPGTVEP